MALQLMLFRNTKEGTPVSILTTLSEAFGIEGFTISISWSWILKQWREFNKGSAVEFLVDEWWHQMLETVVRVNLTCHYELQTLWSYFQE